MMFNYIWGLRPGQATADLHVSTPKKENHDGSDHKVLQTGSLGREKSPSETMTISALLCIGLSDSLENFEFRTLHSL